MNGSVVHDLVRHAGNISVHVIAGEDLAEQSAARAASAGEPFSAFEPCPICRNSAVAGALGVSMLLQPLLRHRERRSHLSDGHCRRCRPLRPLALDRGERRRLALLQLLLHAAALYLHYHRSDQCRGVRAVCRSGHRRLQSRGTRADANRPALQRVQSIESLYAFSRKLAGPERSTMCFGQRHIRSRPC